MGLSNTTGDEGVGLGPRLGGGWWRELIGLGTSRSGAVWGRMNGDPGPGTGAPLWFMKNGELLPPPFAALLAALDAAMAAVVGDTAAPKLPPTPPTVPGRGRALRREPGLDSLLLLWPRPGDDMPNKKATSDPGPASTPALRAAAES